MLFHNAVLGS